jgi:hypothetical protein
MTNQTHPEERIRRRRRATSSGVGLSSTTEARSANPNHDEEVEDLDFNEEVLAQAREGQPFRPTTQQQQPARDEDEEAMEGFTPRNRMRDVRTRGGNYEREYRLQLLHRMLMRRVPLDEIARELDVSVKTVQRDRLELFHRLREEAKRLDINQMIGDTMGFFAEVQGMALRAASIKKYPMNIRLAAMRTALSSRNDQHKFLHAAGVFDVLRFRMTEDDATGDLEKLMEITDKILSEEEDIKKVEDENKDVMDSLSQFDFDEEEIEVRLL